jgi:hypothetical protein
LLYPKSQILTSGRGELSSSVFSSLMSRLTTPWGGGWGWGWVACVCVWGARRPLRGSWMGLCRCSPVQSRCGPAGLAADAPVRHRRRRLRPRRPSARPAHPPACGSSPAPR